MNKAKLRLPVLVFLFTAFLLTMVQLKVDSPIILLERFLTAGGWIEIPVIAFYGAFIAYKIQDPAVSAKWRRISWTVFTVVFFSQLLLGLTGFEKFLMTGELHLPVPMMIIGGPVFRAELSVMTLLFLSTVILTGPAWCSQLCYFGAIDNSAAGKRRPEKGRIRNRLALKTSVLFIVVLSAQLLRWMNVEILTATILAASFGLIGLVIILAWSPKQGKMMNCLIWCPIGTVVNYMRFINPFRMYIEKKSCTLCYACTASCNYDALSKENIGSGKPGITCTLCGDCLSSCHANSIKYKFARMKPGASRNLWLFLTISLHAVFLALGRI